MLRHEKGLPCNPSEVMHGWGRIDAIGVNTPKRRYGVPYSVLGTRKVEGSSDFFVIEFFLSLLSRKPALRNVGNAHHDDTPRRFRLLALLHFPKGLAGTLQT